MSARTAPKATPHRCGGCGGTWSALGAAHCATCHTTFSTAGNFDRHRTSARKADGCLPPASDGFVLNSRGTWGLPGRDDEDAA